MNIIVDENPVLRPLTKEESDKLCTQRIGKDGICDNEVFVANKCKKHAK